MPHTHVVYYQKADGNVPLLDWLDSLSEKVRAKCYVRIERLRDWGHELRRPEADMLRDGIYELRVKFGSVNYRMLYFFHEKGMAVLSHGLTKERVVPEKEIARALTHKSEFTQNPDRHTYQAL